ncbi:jacalin-related lectin 3 isoform X1 [Lycium barbarum]|uniref:jacalin-related lectin 3 isoform X1 n=1 Tax=Lycium barbarum TaxID=112863 RepID=UPI00293E6BC1|nr:jacalin-related lectin 3 isoform X1 [Lycium barbarum]XP_060190993.1 jacalin-related lectin 3 isoform X1 [Lycium barbarum]
MSFENHGKQTISVGPWGGEYGLHWDDGVYSTIRQLEIAHGTGVDSLKVEYDKNGTSVWSEKHGGSGGAKTDKIRLNYPDEFLTSMHGYYGSLNERGSVFVRSLTFHSNKRTYGPYGVQQGTYFTLPSSRGKIVGFHGKSGWYLDAIGVYIDPIYKSLPINSVVQSQQHHNIVHSQQSIVQGMENFEYSTIQGSLGKNFDLIVAVRHKEENSKILPPSTLLRQTSSSSSSSGSDHDSSSSESNKKVATVAPAPIERVPSKTVKGVVTYCPWGGNGGSVFDDGIYDGVRQVYLSRNVGIVSIRACYDKNGQAVWGSKNGGTGGFKTEKIIFDYPSEILTHITGYYGPTMIMGPNIIQSLTFHTTKGKHGPYGEEQGQQFSTKLKEGMIVGFHGRKGLFLDALGVHVLEGKVVPCLPPAAAPNTIKPNAAASVPSLASPVPPKSIKPVGATVPSLPTPAPPKPAKPKAASVTEVDDSPQWSFKLGKKGLSEETKKGKRQIIRNGGVQRIVKDPAPYGPGPWGGEGGKPWDDGVFTGIKQIILTQSSEAICCIEIEYDRNGQSVWSVKHGANVGKVTNRVKLEYPHEVLTCITGFYGPISKDMGLKVVKSLTFHTTRRKFGPFGEELGTYFTSSTTEGKVVGFHGRSGMYLDAIGVHMQHWLGNQRTSKHSLLKMFH